MASVNRIILIGRIGQNPEVKIVGESKVATFCVATSDLYKYRNGNQVEDTEWHSAECWGNQAEIAEKWLDKGSLIYLEGKLKTEKWEKDNHKFQRHKVRVSSFTMLGGKPETGTHTTHDNGEMYGSTPAEKRSPDPVFQEQQDDDLPF
jgi:single-strand DNA-binding protein